MRIVLTISLLLTSMALVLAQPVALPLTTNFVLQEYAKAHPEEAEAKLKSAPAALTLPFMDDFSYDGPYPMASLWMDNDVFVNGTLAMNPPSIGVATLDGLDAAGLPYADSEGWSDTLTSQVIDLTGLTVSDNIVLSFFAQPQGLGDAPESIDRLILEFKDNIGDWQQVQTISGDFVGDFQYSTHLIGSLYIGPEFQFRFRNFSARTGFVDLWHIDYVKLDEGRLENDQTFDDVCFTTKPQSVLEEFTAMPWRHFLEDILGETNFNIAYDLKNHSANNINVTGLVFRVDETTNDENILQWMQNNTNIGAGETVNVLDNTTLTTDDFIFGNVPAAITQARITSQYHINAAGQENITNQRNFNLTNDTIATETIFANYFSYDDGTAEYNVGLDGEGSQAAVRFRPNIDDELRAIEIHIPYAADDVSVGQTFALKVWESDPNFGEPSSTDVIYSKEFTPQYGSGIGGFHSYEIDPPIQLSGAQDYFIGWEQITIADYGIPIGMDKNNPQASENNYYNLGLGWQPFPDNLKGALMIRAVVSGDPFYTANQVVLNAAEIAEIFPNPTSDNLFIHLKSNNYEDYIVQIYNSNGQVLYQSELTNSIAVNTLPSGVYFVQIKEKNTANVYYEKFIKK